MGTKLGFKFYKLLVSVIRIKNKANLPLRLFERKIWYYNLPTRSLATSHFKIRETILMVNPLNYLMGLKIKSQSTFKFIFI